MESNSSHSWHELVELMSHPDPAVRDGWALEQLAEGVFTGQWADELSNIREAVIGLFDRPETQARTFAPLVLSWLLRCGEVDRSIFDTCADWYLAEEDTRGYDQELGWLHAIAHGADCLGMCAQFGAAQPAEVLNVLAKRVVTADDPWCQQEDLRIVSAVIRVLVHHPSTPLDAWFLPLEQAVENFLSSEHVGAMPGWSENLRAVASATVIASHQKAVVDNECIDIPQVSELVSRSLAVLQSLAPWVFAPGEPRS